MIALKATVQNGRIEFKAPDELCDGTEVRIELTPIHTDKIGLDESEWRDDPAALADWEAWIQTIEPFDISPEEEADMARFDEAMRRFNIDAVRKQMGKVAIGMLGRLHPMGGER